MATVLVEETVTDMNPGNHRKATDTLARPEAVCFVPCSISTDHLGKRVETWLADCLASSTLFTMMRERTASGFVAGGDIRDRSEMKTVVLPEPVGNETPIRDAPDARASVQASRQCS